ncbi:FecR family protein [Peristeroidobacter soli]|uniref:FecR family protein n=1 Tax=Peristeroidobacter soli TaxID=2497877 RepID=UPI00101C6791|nr:FecR domain-containing protein [Peristeroidobacter soli]
MAQSEGNALSGEAAAWVARVHGPEVTREVRDELARWMDADPSHAVAYLRAEAAWERMERLKAVPVSSLAPEQTVAPWRMTRRIALAGGLGLCAASAAGWWIFSLPDTYESAIGERRIIALEDGSRVTLNTASVLRVRFTDSERSLHLVSGEALFEVAHNPLRPFVVKAASSHIRALGTAFSVRLRSDLAEVTVTEGTVVVVEAPETSPPPDPARQIAAGSGAVVDRTTVAKSELAPDVLRQRLAWSEGVIELRGETLEQAAEEFSRYRTKRIIVADPRIASIRIGGRFPSDEADAFLRSVQSGFPVRIIEGADGTVYLVHRD